MLMTTSFYLTFRLFFFLMVRPPPTSTLFPTRRSSDLLGTTQPVEVALGSTLTYDVSAPPGWVCLRPSVCRWKGSVPRSEEHTSELQSRRDLVCRLLLEKKKKKNTSIQTTYLYSLKNLV